MSAGSLPQRPRSGLNADPGRVQQRQADDRARAGRTHHLRSPAPEGLHRLANRVRSALRAHRGTR